MAAPQNKTSVAYWQGVAARWKVVALAALTALVMVIIFAVVLVGAESAAKMDALEQLKAEREAKEAVLREARDREKAEWLRGHFRMRVREAEFEKAQAKEE